MDKTNKWIFIIAILLLVSYLAPGFLNGDYSNNPSRFYINLGSTIFKILIIVVGLKVAIHLVGLWTNHKEKFEEKVRREIEEKSKK